MKNIYKNVEKDAMNQNLITSQEAATRPIKS